jgi:WD40 repeat protein
MPSGGILFTLGNHTQAITGMSWRADSQMLATASEDGRLIQWLAEDGFPARSINAQSGGGRGAQRSLPGVMAVHYARGGQLATCGRDNTARVWNTNGNQAALVDGFTDLPSQVAFSHDDARLFIGDFTGKVRVWGVKERKFVGELSTNPE